MLGVVFAASASLGKPIGDQTKALMDSEGKDRLGDFARLGVAMNPIAWAASSWPIPLLWPPGSAP